MPMLLPPELFSYADLMSYGSDLPSQGGMAGNMARPQDDMMGSKLLQLIRLHHIFGAQDQSTQDQMQPITTINDALNNNNGILQPKSPQPPLATPGNNAIGSQTTDNAQQTQTGNAKLTDYYTPEHQMIDQMNAMINQMPERNKPGIVRKIFASIAGLGGMQAADKTMYAPYYDQLSDWKTKFDAVSKAANDERLNNANARQAATSLVAQEDADRRMEMLAGRYKTLETQGQQRIDLSQKRFASKQEYDNAKLELMRETAKGGVLNIDDAGNARMVYKDGTIKDIPEINDWSFEQKQRLKGELAVQVAGAGAAAKAANEKHRVANVTYKDPISGETIEGTKDLDTGVITPSSVKGDTSGNPVVAPPKSAPSTNAAMITKKEADAAQLYMASHPEVRSYIKVDKNGVHVTKPGSFAGVAYGPTEQQYNDIQQAIFGQSAIKLPVADQNRNANANVKKAPKAPAGYKYVPKPGGGWTAVPDPTNTGQ